MEDTEDVVLKLLLAVIIGGLIGLDRAYQGRAAGFRTHILVCLASTTLMLLIEYPWTVYGQESEQWIRVDPTRIAQGIMTGIGFLGAGVIIQDKQVVRGLTTAASIWITAALGIMVGAGLYFPAVLAAILTLVALTVFNRLIQWLPMRHFASLAISFKRHESMSEQQLVELLARHGAVLSKTAYRLDNDGNSLSYQMTIRLKQLAGMQAITDELLMQDHVQAFSLRLISD